MGTEFLIRAARPDDWPWVSGLLVELGRGVAEGTADDPTHRMHFAGHIRQISNVTLIAEHDEEVVGVLDMEYYQRLGDHRPQAYVNDVVVTERLRGAGIGKALMDRAEELARRRGCFRMALVTSNRRDEAHRFYERRGWTAFGTWFVKPLLDDEA